MAIKAILFDYGGVLTPHGRVGSNAAIIQKSFGIDIGWEKLDDLHDALRRGKISTEKFFEEMSRRHGSDTVITEADWHAASDDVFTKNETVYELAEELKSHGLQVGILSNVYEMAANMIRQKGNYEGFDPIILSYDVKLAKPDIEIFQLAVERVGVKPEEIIFVDDQEKNIPPAQSLGMHTVLAVDETQTVTDIKRVLKQENGLQL